MIWPIMGERENVSGGTVDIDQQAEKDSNGEQFTSKYATLSDEVSMYLEEASKRPLLTTKEEKELFILKENISFLEKEFNTKIIVENADKFKHDKSKFALPNKPAIIIE